MHSAYLAFLAAVAVRTFIIALVLTVGLRILGRKQAGQMNLFDLALIMSLANAVQNAMTMGKGEIGVGAVSAGTLLLMSLVAGILFRRVPSLERTAMGGPVTLILNGVVRRHVLDREGVSTRELHAVMREHGLTRYADVQLAVLEQDGAVSIVPVDAATIQGRRGLRAGARRGAD